MMFNGSIWLGMSGTKHLLPHTFMAQTGTTLQTMLLLVLATHFACELLGWYFMEVYC